MQLIAVATITTTSTITLVQAAPQGATGVMVGEKKEDDFDLYLLQLAWMPYFCCIENQHEGYCHIDYQLPNSRFLVLQGLWPEYAKRRGTKNNTSSSSLSSVLWPQYCKHNDGTDYSKCFKCNDNHQQAQAAHASSSDCHEDYEAQPYCRLDRSRLPKSLQIDLLYNAPGYSADHSLGDHVWIKHGSCTGLSATSYLQQAVTAMDTVVTLLQEFLSTTTTTTRSDPIWVSMEDVWSHVPGALLQSKTIQGKNTLTYITTCWEKDDQNMLGQLMTACPIEIQQAFGLPHAKDKVHLSTITDAMISRCFTRSHPLPEGSVSASAIDVGSGVSGSASAAIAAEDDDKTRLPNIPPDRSFLWFGAGIVLLFVYRSHRRQRVRRYAAQRIE